MRYRTIYTDNKVIVLSSYSGKTVRGIAKCNPKDTFNPEKGEEIAKARCNAKIAELRFKNACKKLSEANKIMFAITNYQNKMSEYLSSAREEKSFAENKLQNILDNT